MMRTFNDIGVFCIRCISVLKFVMYIMVKTLETWVVHVLIQ